MHAVSTAQATLRVLGPLELHTDGRSVPVGRRRERIVLGLLALRTPQPVPAVQLREVLAPGESAADARVAVHVSISRLRRVLEPYRAAIRFGGDAYTLDPGELAVDAIRFRTLVANGLATTNPRRRAALLRTALDLWRGDALPEIDRPEMRVALTAETTELWLLAQHRRLELDVARGRAAEAVAVLSGIVGERPTHEGFVALLMTALAADGRHAEALDVYAQTRRHLADNFGVDPGSEVARIHLDLLRQDAAQATESRIAVRRVDRRRRHTIVRALPPTRTTRS